MTDISNTDDIIDVRSIIERVEELEEEQENLISTYNEAETEEELADAVADLADFWNVKPEEVTDILPTLDDPNDCYRNSEYEMLADFLDELKGMGGGDHQWRGDWYPVTLIRHDYFTEYAEELVTDIGDLPREIPAYIAIDWEKTAENLKVDYSSADFDGVEYLFR